MKKKRLALIATLTLSLVACAATLAACKDGGKKDTFSAPENVKVTADVLTWDAVENAVGGYTVKINEKTVAVNEAKLDLTSQKATAELKEGDNKLSVKVNATDKMKESAYSAEVTYKYTKPNTGNPPKPDEPKPPVTEELSAEAKAFNAEVAELATVDENSTAEQINAAKAALDTALENYDALSEKDKTAVATAKATLDEKKEAYDALIAAFEAEIKEIKDKVDAIDGTTTVTLAYYNSLLGIKEEIEALDGYAATLWAETDTETLEAEITRVLNTAVSSNSDIEVFVNGANGTVTLLYEATNVRGDTVKGNAPELTITLDAGAAVNTDNAAFSENDGLYIYKVNFVKKGGDVKTEAGYELKVQYTIGGGEQQTVIFKEIKDDAYINTTDKILIKENKIQYAGAPGDAAYLDIYEVENISIGEDNTNDPVIYGFPLIKKVPVKNGMPMNDLRRQLAREYTDLLIGNTYEVRFVMYKMTEGENDEITISNIKNALVSHDTYTLDLTDYDYKFPIEAENIFDVGVWGGSTNFSLINNGNVAGFISQFEELYPDLLTVDNVADYFRILIGAYEVDTAGNANATPAFTKVVPFENQAYKYNTFMQEWASKYFKDGGADNGTVNFILTLTIQLKETVNGQPNPLAKDFREFASANVRKENGYDGTYTFRKSDVTLPTDIQMGRTNEPIFLQKFTLEKDIINGHVSYIEIYFKKGADTEEYYTAYILYDAETGTFTIHKNADGSDTGRALIKGGNEYYCSANDLNIWVKNNYDSTFDLDGESWYFKTKIIDNEQDDTYLFGDGESEWVTFYKAPEENA